MNLSGSLCSFWNSSYPKRQNNNRDIMVLYFFPEISDLWCYLAFFFIVSTIKHNFPFVIIMLKNKGKKITIFSQNCNFFEVLHELVESIWKEFSDIELMKGCIVFFWKSNWISCIHIDTNVFFVSKRTL